MEKLKPRKIVSEISWPLERFQKLHKHLWVGRWLKNAKFTTVKFMYSEKATKFWEIILTKFWEIILSFLTLLVNFKKWWFCTKCLRNHPLYLHLLSNVKKCDFFKLWGLLRKYELYLRLQNFLAFFSYH